MQQLIVLECCRSPSFRLHCFIVPIDVKSPGIHLSDYVGFGLAVCVHILSRPPSFYVCMKGLQEKGSGCDVPKMSLSASVMLECAQSVCVWDRWLALFPKVLLLVCILYLLLIRQTACIVCVPLFVCECEYFACAHPAFYGARAHRKMSSHIIVCVDTQGSFVLRAGVQGFCSMLSWEIESGKCSGVKALPRWIHLRGDMQTPAAKWCRSARCLQAGSLVHTDTLGAADRSSAEVKSCHK